MGNRFVDEGGLPNDCTTGSLYQGDPAVEVFRSGAAAYFYIGSLYVNTITGTSTARHRRVQGVRVGKRRYLACGSPIVVASGASGEFLDKDFLTIDQKRVVCIM